MEERIGRKIVCGKVRGKMGGRKVGWRLKSKIGQNIGPEGKQKAEAVDN